MVEMGTQGAGLGKGARGAEPYPEQAKSKRL